VTIYDLGFNPDSQRLVTSEGGTMKLWGAANGNEIATLAGHSKSVTNMTFSADGQRLASANLDGIVKLWDIPVSKKIGK
jgi:WD40 repeat protein